jgi:hypothetical protein
LARHHQVEVVIRRDIEGFEDLVEQSAMLGGNAYANFELPWTAAQVVDDRTQLDRFGPCPEDNEGLQSNLVGLFVTVGDAALGEIVGRHLDGDAITGKHADSVAAQFSGEMGEHDALGIQLNAKLSGRELFDNRSGYFNTILFAHLPPWVARGIGGKTRKHSPPNHC